MTNDFSHDDLTAIFNFGISNFLDLFQCPILKLKMYV